MIRPDLPSYAQTLPGWTAYLNEPEVAVLLPGEKPAGWAIAQRVATKIRKLGHSCVIESGARLRTLLKRARKYRPFDIFILGKREIQGEFVTCSCPHSGHTWEIPLSDVDDYENIGDCPCEFYPRCEPSHERTWVT